MMDTPMLVSRLIEHAADAHPTTEVVARRVDGSVARSCWAEVGTCSKRLANALRALDITGETRVASLAWNTLDHIEVFYAVLGLGVPLHTLNARLPLEDLAYTARQVKDTVCFIDPATLHTATQLASLVPDITRWIYLDEALPEGSPTPPGLVTRKSLESGVGSDFDWPTFDERRAATICFTSGTTGKPKAVAYSHRSITLTSMSMSMADMYADLAPGELPVVMPIANIFHANGWMMPFTAPMNGHKLVLPGRAFDAASIIALMKAEAVTMAGAVPTVWLDIVAELNRSGVKLPALHTALVAGANLPGPLYDELIRQGIQPRQTWGMTEVPGATLASPPPSSGDRSAALRRELGARRQGRVGFQSQLRIVDANGQPVPHDGVQVGALQVRGPAVAGRYLGDSAESNREWLDTGDIARLHPDSTLEIVDREKDVIKSGGEWISSPQLEAAAMTHPAVAEAAAIAVSHPRWQERPMLICVIRAGETMPTADSLRDHLSRHLIKLWLPNEIRFVDSLPRMSTGKIDKARLRAEYARQTTDGPQNE